MTCYHYYQQMFRSRTYFIHLYLQGFHRNFLGKKKYKAGLEWGLNRQKL